MSLFFGVMPTPIAPIATMCGTNYICYDLKFKRFIFSVEIIDSSLTPDITYECYASDDTQKWEKIHPVIQKNGMYTLLFMPTDMAMRYFYLKSSSNLSSKMCRLFGYDSIEHFKGIKVYTDANVSEEIRSKIQNQTYEEAEINFISKSATSEDIILELGSSLGVVSSVIAKHIQPQQYICVEANPALIPLTKTTHFINTLNNITVLNGAVASDDKEQCIPFYINKNCWASSLDPKNGTIRVENVPVYNLNRLIKQYNPTYLIADIEGGEFSIFNEQADLSGVNKICIEIHAGLGSKQDALIDFFIKKGFQLVEKENKASICVCLFKKA